MKSLTWSGVALVVGAMTFAMASCSGKVEGDGTSGSGAAATGGTGGDAGAAGSGGSGG